MAGALATSLDGHWAAVREARALRVLGASRGELSQVAELELDGDDAQLAWLGPPATLAIVLPDACVLVQPPDREPIARLPVGASTRLAAVSGPRCVLLAGDDVTVIRVAPRAAATVTLEVGPQIEAAIGLDRNQALFVQARQLALWDIAACHPVARLGLELPPVPRVIGSAAGHLWAHRERGHELVLYRLSDGRPFGHPLGAPIRRVVSHPASPIVVVETDQGIGRIHCFAHSAAPVDVPAGTTVDTELALLVTGDDIALIGHAPGAATPWQVALRRAATGA